MTSVEKLYSLFCQYPLVCTDSRNIEPNSIFFALKGEHFDGNRFALSALEKGARYAVVDATDLPTHPNLLQVEDTLVALQQLAQFHRKQLSHLKCIAICGSNGKTTTKELTAKVLATTFPTQATQGNRNNHIGVPLTLLQLKPEIQFAVIEIGANHLKETYQLCQLAQPNFGLVTNCGKDHLEGFGSLEGVIEANCEVYKYLQETKGVAFIHINDKTLVHRAIGVKTVYYGNAIPGVESVFEGFSLTSFPFLRCWVEYSEIQTHLFGDFQLPNVLAAACIGYHFGVSKEQIKQGIESYIPQNNRSQLIDWQGNQVLLDAYNANPSSMEATIRSFAHFPHSNKIVIAGDMFELGEYSEIEHKGIIHLLKDIGFEKVIFVGEEFGKWKTTSNALFLRTTDELKAYLTTENWKDKFIFVKGSRAIALEKAFL